MNEVIEVGDVVTFGSGKIHWEVRFIGTHTDGGPPYYALRSGMTGRMKHGRFDNLTIHTKRKANQEASTK